MKNFLTIIRFWRDEDGQAMTEFVIVIPVVIFVFALVLQTVFVAQVSQMMNYAAFTAARSYATTFSKEKGPAGSSAQAHTRAVKKAEFAANLAMAPVSGAVHGEGLSVWSPLRRSADRSLFKSKGTLYHIGEGIVVSTFYRMKNFRLPKPGETDTSVVTCTFEYMCPIDVPGVAELWNYLFRRDQLKVDNLGDVRIENQFDPNRNNFIEGNLSSGELSSLITTAESALDNLGARIGAKNFNGKLSRFLNKNYGSKDFLGAPISIRLFAKSAVGMEPWDGNPNMPLNSETASNNSDFKQCEDDMAALEKAVADQNTITSNVCADAIAKSNAWVQAKGVYNQCVADNPTNHVTKCAAQKSDRDSKFVAFKAREQDCKDEGETLGDRNDDLAEYECAAAAALANP